MKQIASSTTPRKPLSARGSATPRVDVEPIECDEGGC